MEHSSDIEPMRRGANGPRLAKLLHAMSDRFTAEPIRSQSEHFVRPGEIGGAIAVPTFMQPELDLNQIGEISDDLRFGTLDHFFDK